MWEVDGDLSLNIRVFFGFIFLVFFLGDYASDSEFSGDAQRYGTDDGSRTKIGELIAMVSHALGSAVVAVYKGGVGFPRVRRLILELLAVGVVVFDALCDLGVDCFLNDGRDSPHLRSELSNILEMSEHETRRLEIVAQDFIGGKPT
jgi:hypothetical protein